MFEDAAEINGKVLYGHLYGLVSIICIFVCIVCGLGSDIILFLYTTTSVYILVLYNLLNPFELGRWEMAFAEWMFGVNPLLYMGYAVARHYDYMIFMDIGISILMALFLAALAECRRE